MLGEVHTVSTSGFVLSLAFVFLTTALWVRFQSVVARLRAAQANSRWASNIRDLIGFLGATCLSFAFHQHGLPWPAAILFAGTLGVLLELLRRGGRPRPVLTWVVSLAFVLLIGAWPQRAVDGANRLASAVMRVPATSDRG